MASGDATYAPVDMQPPSGLPPQPRYVDIGINLTDPIFHGIYRGKRAHEDDFELILERARKHNVKKLVVTGSDLKESRKAVEIAKRHPGLCYATIGVHPCSAKQFLTSSTLLEDLRSLIISSTSNSSTPSCVAIGEIGLDYDRLFLTDKQTQLKHFEAQLDLAVSLHTSGALPRPIPLFLHSRAAAEDFEALLEPRLRHLPAKGVVHSFTGTAAEMFRLMELGLHVGVNGCSLKTEENVDVVRQIPLERLQIETDGPWCEIRPSSAGMKALGVEAGTVLEGYPRGVKKEKWTGTTMVKGRNEPCMVGLVAECVARVKGISVQEVADAAWANSCGMFGLEDRGQQVNGGT